MTMHLYVEGGGDSDKLHRKCREGFSKFLAKAGLKANMPRIVAAGGRQQAFDGFRHALARGEPCMLLVDSETAVDPGRTVWEHLRQPSAGGWSKPTSAKDEHCHLMVQCMESWFLADKLALASFFKQGFNEKPLPANPKIDEIAKKTVLVGLENATRQCLKRGQYGKGAHSFEILAAIDSAKVISASPNWAGRFISELKRQMGVA